MATSHVSVCDYELFSITSPFEVAYSAILEACRTGARQNGFYVHVMQRFLTDFVKPPLKVYRFCNVSADTKWRGSKTLRSGTQDHMTL